MAGILWWLHWGVIPVLMLTAIPYFFVRLQQANRLFAWERERTPLGPEGLVRQYAADASDGSKEVRLFDLGPRLRQWFLDARSVLRRERIALRRDWMLAGLAAQMIEDGIRRTALWQSRRIMDCSPWAAS